MPIEIKDEKANEQSTFALVASFKDEEGDAVIPNTITWTLSDEDGNTINEREDVEIAVPDSSVTIVLSADDLQISNGFAGLAEKRILTIEATYDSDLGMDLPLTESAHFVVNNLKAIA